MVFWIVLRVSHRRIRRAMLWCDDVLCYSTMPQLAMIHDATTCDVMMLRHAMLWCCDVECYDASTCDIMMLRRAIWGCFEKVQEHVKSPNFSLKHNLCRHISNHTTINADNGMVFFICFAGVYRYLIQINQERPEQLKYFKLLNYWQWFEKPQLIFRFLAVNNSHQLAYTVFVLLKYLLSK